MSIHSFQIPLSTSAIRYERREHTDWEGPGRQAFHQVIGVSVSRHAETKCYLMRNVRKKLSFPDIPNKGAQPRFNHENISVTPKLRDILKSEEH